MDLLSIDNITRKTKSIFINPQVATYAGIGITTTMLAYYTLFSSYESSKPEENKDTPKEEEPEEEKEEEKPVEEKEEEPIKEPVEEKEEALAAPLTGGKRKKKSRMNKKKDKKNKSKHKQSK